MNRINIYGDDNEYLRQYIIHIRGYSPYLDENKKMSIQRYSDNDVYYLYYSRNRREIITSNGSYYDPIKIGKGDYEKCITGMFLRELKLGRILGED